MKRTKWFLPALLVAALANSTITAEPNPRARDRASVVSKPPVKALFAKGEDSLCVNDWWNRTTNEIINLKVPRDQVVAFGLYTVANRTLKLSAQLYPLYPDETREVRLEIKKRGFWTEMARQPVNDLGWATCFRIENWDHSRDHKYRLRHGKRAVFEGLIRKDPVRKDEIKVAALSCNSNHDRGLRPEYTRNINYQNPDLIFFAGDQSYDHKQHTAAWLKFGLTFKELIHNRPCVSIPDDHDIGQGNLWGENGKVASTPAGDDGGYFYHPEYVNMVQRQQTANLPDPFDPTPVEQGIGVYYTRLIVGGVDFAIIEDRKFKTGPRNRHPMKGPRPDHILDPNYDPTVIDTRGLQLLGERQLKFLEAWKNRLHADLDSNGWPQTGRNRALTLIKQANAVHIGGDQHIATLVQHGIRKFRDGPWAFIVPAIDNSYYGRWWWPADEKPGANPDPDSPLPWTGDYLDGFNNKITMHAYANPNPAFFENANSKAENAGKPGWGDGWGLIRFKKSNREVTFECWPRYEDLTRPGARQFPGWPRTIKAAG